MKTEGCVAFGQMESQRTGYGFGKERACWSFRSGFSSKCSHQALDLGIFDSDLFRDFGAPARPLLASRMSDQHRVHGQNQWVCGIVYRNDRPSHPCVSK